MNPLLIRFVVSVATVIAVDLYKEGKYAYKKKRDADKFTKAKANGEILIFPIDKDTYDDTE
jgi:hypothetical protein